MSSLRPDGARRRHCRRRRRGGGDRASDGSGVVAVRPDYVLSQADLEEEWSQLDIEQRVRVVRDGGRIVGYGVVRERGERWEAEGYVHPDAFGRGLGKLIATGFEEDAMRDGARWTDSTSDLQRARKEGIAPVIALTS